MQKLSTFFTLEDGLRNKLGINQQLPENKVYIYNMNYTASRLDLFKFTIDSEIKVVNWFMNDEVAEKLGVHIASSARKGLGVEFKTSKNNREVFELIKNKVLGKNIIKLSVAELIFNEELDTIFISFKTNIEFEQCKIGIFKKDQPFRWLYLNGEKVANVEKKSTNGGFKKQSNTSTLQGYKKPGHSKGSFHKGSR